MLDKKHLANTELSTLIYCRVSSVGQANDGNGLESQEQRCRVLAQNKNLPVEKVFKDVWSGGGDFTKRVELMELFGYIDKFKYKKFIVIVDDTSRLARDVQEHIKIRGEFAVRGVEIECTNFKFENSAEGELVETIMAAQNQYHRKSNQRQVIQKQKSRLELGYWPFYPPPGYKSKIVSGHGKILSPIEPAASIIKEALEGFASGRFEKQIDVLHFLRSKKFSGDKPIYLEKVKRLLTRPIYAGYIEYEDWDVSRRIGRHEPVVSIDVFKKVENKLNDSVKKYTRNTKNSEFPLRGNVICPCCCKPVTAAFSTGKLNNRFGYYRCNENGCMLKNLSIPKDVIEKEFLQKLSDIKPSQEMVEYGLCIMKEVFESSKAVFSQRIEGMRKDIYQSRLKIKKLLETAIASKTQEMKDSCEEGIILEKEKQRKLQEQIDNIEQDGISVETPLKDMEEFLKNPKELWVKSDIELKNIIFNMVFDERLVYDKKTGFETPKISIVYSLFDELSGDKTHDVEMEGVEPSSI